MDAGTAHISKHMQLVFHRIHLCAQALLAPLQLDCFTVNLPQQGMGLIAYLQLGGAMARTGQQGRARFLATNIVKLAQALALHHPTIGVRPRVDPSTATRRFYSQAMGHSCCHGQRDGQRLLVKQLVFFALNQRRV